MFRLLADLIPALLASPPIDPCDGQPLRYQASDREFVIYSVGPDGIDDRARRLVDATTGDVVIRVRRKTNIP